MIDLASRYTKASLARSMSNAKEVKGAAPLNNGLPIVATFQNSGDGGVALFSTAHPCSTGLMLQTL